MNASFGDNSLFSVLLGRLLQVAIYSVNGLGTQLASFASFLDAFASFLGELLLDGPGRQAPRILGFPGPLAPTHVRDQHRRGRTGGVPHDGPRHSALHEIDSSHVLVSREWAKAVEAGRWSREVRPFTCNRRHTLYRQR